jgi:hypothetical protein
MRFASMARRHGFSGLALQRRERVDEVDIVDAVDKWDLTTKSTKADERGEGREFLAKGRKAVSDQLSAVSGQKVTTKGPASLGRYAGHNAKGREKEDGDFLAKAQRAQSLRRRRAGSACRGAGADDGGVFLGLE